MIFFCIANERVISTELRFFSLTFICMYIRVGPDLLFHAGCRMSSACQIRPDMPDIRPDNPAKCEIRPDNLSRYPAK